ncbi:hypothetical protein SAMN05421850_101813 [Lutimaribacter saemankumensis]|uniref:Uncharacterized protein n=1 Tax=Lutimaribacter saemankumensis TaxID=490829 RepID=A0A1G8I8B4_9RHOB|nr:hypothetical protein SAMN05421850_101813 [Lutimaribacter saemankumensis]
MMHAARTRHLPLCQPAGWVALWRRMAAISCLNT